MSSLFFENELISFFCSDPFAVKFEVRQGRVSLRESRLSQKSLTQELEKQVRETLKTERILKSPPFLSVSHSQFEDQMGAVVIGSSQRIGVDLENLKRKVHPKVEARIVHESEHCFHLNVLEFWVIKEAVFKCNPDNLGTVLPHYQVTAWDSNERQGEVQFVSRQETLMNRLFRVKLLQVESWLIAIAKGK
jgi:phosphopantetheinyl transferase